MTHRRFGRSSVTHYPPSFAFALLVEPKRNRRRSKIPVQRRRTGGGSEQRCQNLSASGGGSRAQVHRRTQDNGLDRHASIRVSGPRKAGKTTSAALVDDVTAAAQEATQSTEREHHVDHTPCN